jgi:Fe-S cluster assembly iron-binding protein IscA
VTPDWAARLHRNGEGHCELKREEVPMITVTERAKERLKEMLRSETDDPSVGLRLATAPSGQFGIAPDREREDDQVVEHQGSPVLLVGQEMANTIGDATIDYDESPPAPRLVIKQG